MSEPNTQEIENFCNFANTDVGTAALWLRRYGNIDSAIGAWFDNDQILPPAEPGFERDWDESAFHAGREQIHGPENRPQPSFNIQSADALNPDLFDASPSRPPSRVSGYPGNDDFTMQKFLKNSRGQTMSGQESGVTDGAGGNFRRVDDAHAANSNWAVSLSKSEVRELPQNSDPNERIRREGTPAFLRPAINGDYLPALLTIMQNIPMAKEALLARDISLPDYGNNSEWWDGDHIESSRIVMVDTDGPPPADNSLIHETQRLMAFLEMTERAYGSVTNLLREVGVYSGAASIGANFLSSWKEAMNAAKSDSELKNVFTNVAVNDPREVADGNEAEMELPELDLPITQKSLELGGSLYDAVDEMVWQEMDEDEPLLDVHLRFAEVLCIRVRNRRDGASITGLDVPAEFYPDRYSEGLLETMKPLRKQRREIATKMEQINEMLRRLAVVDDPHRVAMTHSGIALLERAAEHFAADDTRSSTVECPAAQDDMLVDVGEPDQRFIYSQVEEELRALLVRLGEKHNDLRQQQAGLVEELHTATKSYREPSTHPQSSPTPRRYTLRGVTTAPDTTYVLVNPHSTEDLLGSTADQWQWWKLTFSSAPGTSSPVSTVCVDVAAVLHAARHESAEAVLVYATDDAVAYQPEQLPARLRNFVRLDNLAFERELEDAARGNSSNEVARWSSSSSDAGRPHFSSGGFPKVGGGHVPSASWTGFANPRSGGRIDGIEEEDETAAVNITVSDDGIEEDGDPPPYEGGSTDVEMRDEKPAIDLLADEDRILPSANADVPMEERKGG